ncbi:nucleoside recognition domain-containing protein [Sporolituus thermophilus]|uniref:Nucleoside recognition n=1 Tax=Sporolituus thermophilus DSM 23256 TaxID=1123285 RepID=A0A1G7LVM3_9FIRM|nr:nucleoside recognition domain-containing protein [Sporolituus thermophilus]SDF53426.1 Nucleoside recognition [Sporolituus thermophilus DSM 23256]
MSEAAKDHDKVSLKGWIALAVFILMFSGLFKVLGDALGLKWLSAFDFVVLNGKFGTDLVGKGGVGARTGFMEAFVLFPTVMFAVGVVEVCEHFGALRAAGKLFTPLLRPLLGIPGICGLAFVASLNSSDVGSVLTRQLKENGHITDDERTTFVAYQYAASAPITNTLAADLYRRGLLTAQQATILYPGVILMGTLIGHYVRIVIVAGTNPKYHPLMFAICLLDAAIGMLLMRLFI